MSAKIVEGLREHAVPIDVPLLHPENTRIGDEENISRSLDRFGQVRPIICQKSTGYVVAGNHTLKAAKLLGWDEIAVIVVEMDDEEALSYLVADNRLGQLGGFDDTAHAKLVEKLMMAGKLEGTGWTPDAVDDYLSEVDAIAEVEPEPTEAKHADQEKIAERFANRSQSGPLRQFVLMYDQETGTEVEGLYRRLERAWGMSGMRDVVFEALRRAAAEPPIEGLTPEEQARADAPEPEGDDTPAAA